MEVVSRLAELPTRPPTPPKESSGPLSSQSSDSVQGHSRDTKAGLHTPNESPASTTAAPKSPGGRSKRVGFQLSSSKLVHTSASSPRGHTPGKSSPPSRDIRPAKSILKPAKKPILHEVVDQAQSRDFPRMLEHFAQQLAGTDMSSRLDAYIALNNALKTYKNGPEQRALAEKMPLLVSFIERDLQDADATPDADRTTTSRSTQLAAEVVKLVSTLLWSPTMADELPEQFQLFVLNKSIAVAGSDKVPKVLVSQFLHLLAVQNFRPRILSNTKIDRLLSHLKHIADRVNGKQIVAHRLDIYKRLISQAPELMLSRFRDWYEHIFHALMSDTRAIRDRALSLGFEAGSEFGAAEQVTRTLSSLFNHAVETDGEEQRYGDLFAAKLNMWLTCKEEARQVPQIWACVLMFLRHQPRPLERWTFILPWLQLMKKCFNSADSEIRLQANRAWIRLIFAISPCLTTGDSMVALLCEPIRSQLDRTRGPEQDTRKIRGSVVAVYSTLLYYAIRPGAAHDTLDRYWKACVKPFFTTIGEGSSVLDVQNATEILCSLLGDSIGRTWIPKRATQQLPVRAEEIPRLDCKWVRLRANWVIPVVEAVILDEAWWQTNSEQHPSIRVWKAFIGALAEAGRKEIKVSQEVKVAIAELIVMWDRMLAACKSPQVYSRLIKLFDIATSTLGPLPFTDPKLVCVSNKQYQVAETSVSNTRKSPNSGKSAATILLQILVKRSDGRARQTDIQELFRAVLRVALQSASSYQSKLRTLLEACSSLLPGDNNTQKESKVVLWEAVMQALISELETSKPLESLESDAHALKHEMHDMCEIFECGLALGLTNPGAWFLVNRAIAVYLSKGTGRPVASNVVIESLAKFLSTRLQDSLCDEFVTAAMPLFEHIQWAQSPASAKIPRNGSGMQNPIPSSSSLDPYKHLYGLTDQLLVSLYQNSTQVTLEARRGFLRGVSGLVLRMPLSVLTRGLSKFKGGLGMWVSDPAGKHKVDSEPAIEIFRELIDLWTITTKRIQELPNFDSSSLEPLQTLLLSGFQSRHRAIANLTIKVWNNTFGLNEQIHYPQDLYNALVYLAQSADISLPSVQSHEVDVDTLASINYLNTPADVKDLSEDPDVSIVTPHKHTNSRTIIERAPLSDSTHNKQTISTPHRQKNIIKANSTPRIRHDNSQIEFAAITSSPPNLETIESQLLTERQREVRDRQHAEAAAMFPDLRSSLRAKSHDPKPELPRLQLRGEQDLVHSDIDETHSPTLPSPSGTPYLGSSPTPSQKKQFSRDRHNSIADGATSIPMARHLDKEMPTIQQLSDDSTYYSSYGQTFGEELLALYEEPVEADPSDAIDILMPMKFNLEQDEVFVEAPEEVDPEVSSEAPASPQPEEPVPRHETQAISPNTVKPKTKVESPKSSPAQRKVPTEPETSPQEDVESNQVENQVLNAVEAAASNPPSSQSSQELASQMEPAERHTRGSKRKRSKAEKENKGEKRRRGRPRRHPAPPAEPTKSDDDIEDCIIVAITPANTSRQPTPASSQLSFRSAGFEHERSQTSKDDKRSKKEKKRRWEAAVAEECDMPADQPEPAWKKPKMAPSQETAESSDARQSTENVTASPAVTATPPAPERGLEAAATASDTPILEAAPSLEAVPDIGTATVTEIGPCLCPPADAAQPSSSLAPPTISASEFMSKVTQLLNYAKTVKVGDMGDDIMCGLMDVCKEVMGAKRHK